MISLRYIRHHFARRRATRELEWAKARVALISRQIDENRKSHKPHRPLLGQLLEARNAMLRAENTLRGA